MKTILTNCSVIDCKGTALMKDMTVVIEGNKIADLKKGVYQPVPREEKARVLDLEGGYVTPGLWDVHTHLGDPYPAPNRGSSLGQVIDRAIRAGRNAMDSLRVGITGIRVVGEQDFIDVSWKRAFEVGRFVGPRIFACGYLIIATGGHEHDSGFTWEIDGPFEMRKAVREQLKHGVDQIKLSVTGGVATAGEMMQETQLCFDEVKAATEVAHEKGKRVCAHVGGPQGAKIAIRGGVDCIEHGYYLDDEAIEMMNKNSVFFVPTLNVTQDEEYMRKSGMEQFRVEKARNAGKAHREGFQKAVKARVKIACGADSNPIAERMLKEIELLVATGMTEMEALVAATRTAADLCGVADELGTVEIGKLADLIVVSGNPLENISNLRKLKFVIKDGNMVDIGKPEGLADFWKLFSS